MSLTRSNFSFFRFPKLCFVLLFAAHFSGAHSAESAHIVVSGDPWCPFNCVEATDQQRGYVIDILQRIAEINHLQLDYRIAPWPRTLLQLSDGSIDIAIGVSNVDTAQYWTTTLSWGRLHQAAISVKPTQIEWRELQGLAGKRVLLVKDYDYGTALNQWAIKSTKQVEYIYGERTNEQALSMLLRQRADVFVNSAEVLRWNLRSNPARAQFNLTLNGYRNDFHLAISRHRADANQLRDKLDNGLRKLRTNGELAAILKPYDLKDWGTQ